MEKIVKTVKTEKPKPKMFKDTEFMRKDEFVSHMIRRGRVSKKRAGIYYDLFLKVLKEDVIKKNKSVALRGVITIYRVLHPPRPINNFMTGNKTVMTRERQEYKAKFSVNRKEWVPSGKKSIKEIDI